MNFNDMTDREKSVLLAKVTGWIRGADQEYRPWWIFDTGGHHTHDGMLWRTEPVELPFFDLYEHREMGLAWRVLVWVIHNLIESGLDYQMYKHLFEWDSKSFVLGLPPEQAQRLWLDKILELFIEASLVTAEKETAK